MNRRNFLKTLPLFAVLPSLKFDTKTDRLIPDEELFNLDPNVLESWQRIWYDPYLTSEWLPEYDTEFPHYFGYSLYFESVNCLFALERKIPGLTYWRTEEHRKTINFKHTISRYEGESSYILFAAKNNFFLEQNRLDLINTIMNEYILKYMSNKKINTNHTAATLANSIRKMRT